MGCVGGVTAIHRGKSVLCANVPLRLHLLPQSRSKNDGLCSCFQSVDSIPRRCGGNSEQGKKGMPHILGTCVGTRTRNDRPAAGVLVRLLSCLAVSVSRCCLLFFPLCVHASARIYLHKRADTLAYVSASFKECHSLSRFILPSVHLWHVSLVLFLS